MLPENFHSQINRKPDNHIVLIYINNKQVLCNEAKTSALVFASPDDAISFCDENNIKKYEFDSIPFIELHTGQRISLICHHDKKWVNKEIII